MACQPVLAPTCPIGLESKLVSHEERIRALEKIQVDAAVDVKDLGKKLDTLQYWIMATLGAALTGICAQLVHH
jgi:hypothetical protein